MPALEKFIYAEQIKNNYSLYSDEESASFDFDIQKEYKPSSQITFKLPYFLIPLAEDKLVYNVADLSFLETNIFLNKDGSLYVPFFIHPTSEKIFKQWIGKKYVYIDTDDSIFEATPTSSYRSLLVRNREKGSYFIAKVSIFGNVANGARHIDWCSAEGQHFFCKCTEKAVSNIKNFDLLRDVAAIGITGEIPVHFSNKYEITYGPKTVKTFGTVIRRVDEVFDNNTDKNIFSIASITSVIDRNDCYFEKIYISYRKSFEEFFINDFMFPIFKKLFELFLKYGISLETHCQNTLLEIDADWHCTGRLIYRDFDITCFDRARFPFVFTNEWNEYCSGRLDRTSLFSNLSAREELGRNFFHYLIGNLEKPCLLCARKLKLITKEEAKRIHKKIYSIFRSKLSEYLPLCRHEFYEQETWSYWKNTFKDIDISEIPVPLEKIHSLKKDSHEKIFINSPNLTVTDYYLASNGYILGFSKNIFVELYMPKKGL